MNNLAASEQHAELKRQLEDQMVAELKAQNDPRVFDKGDYFDKVPYTNVGTRNFYERYMRGEEVRAGWVNPSDFKKGKLD